jgi:hypothetical protein
VTKVPPSPHKKKLMEKEYKRKHSELDTSIKNISAKDVNTGGENDSLSMGDIEQMLIK